MSKRTWRLTRWLATSPGRLSVLTAGLIVIGLLFGLIGALTMRNRSELVRDVSARSGPLSVQAQDIYRSLSDADATAASAFLANGVEPPALRARYLDDVTRATSALTVALRSAEGRSATALGVLVNQVPIYTGLIEAARTYNRQGLPLGAAYLREASGLMRQTILPAAQELYRAETARLSAAQDAVSAFPWGATLVGALLLAGLVTTQVYLARRTNRRINRGLLVATLAALVALGWMSAATAGAVDHINTGRHEGSAQVGLLAEARIAALQARADEGLTLIARGDGKAFDDDFVAMMTVLIGVDGTGGLLARAHARAPDDAARATVDTARKHARQWLVIHQQVRTFDNGSQHLEAVRLATGTGRDSAASASSLLDAALAEGIADGGDRFDREAASAGGALRGADAVVGVLAVLLALAAAFGLYQRIAEYR